MSWWHKMPADAGRRPEILAVGWSGFCAWRTLLGIDAQQDFNGRIPRRFTAAEYMWSQNPPDGPGAEIYSAGLQRCLDRGLVAWEGNELVLEPEIYEDWRGAKSDRARKHEERQRQRASRRVTNVTQSHECHVESQESRRVTHVTPPDQTRPENTHPAGARDPGTPEPVAEHQVSTTDVYTRLYEYHRSVVARYAPAGAVRDLGAVGVRHEIRECLHHESLLVQGPGGEKRPRPPEEIERALDVLGIQAKAKADAGEPDPWWPLRKAWKPGTLVEALAMPDAEVAKGRAVRRSRASPRGGLMPPPTSQPPNSHEYFAELARRQKEGSNAASDPTE